MYSLSPKWPPRATGRCSPGVYSSCAFLLPLVSLLLLACADSTPQDPEAIVRVERPSPVVHYTTEEILAAVYGLPTDVPADSYRESFHGSLYYVNTVSVKPLFNRELVWRELCTDERDQAFAWAESTRVYGSGVGNVTAERETDRFFEFTQVGRYGWPVLVRAHKCSYLDRFVYDRFAPQPLLGVFNARPIDTRTVNDVFTYLWFIEHYNWSGSSQLESAASDGDGLIEHRLIETRLAEIVTLDRLGPSPSEFLIDAGSQKATEHLPFEHVFNPESAIPPPSF